MWPRAVDCGEIPAYPLRAWLSDMQPSADRADRGNARGPKLIGEHQRSLLVQRVPRGTSISLSLSADT
jgi:hypothetical protein